MNNLTMTQWPNIFVGYNNFIYLKAVKNHAEIMKLEPDNVFAIRYKLVKQIGVGGFAEVWLAMDEWAKNVPVALKIYALETGLDDYGIRQFTNEYADLKRLNHPNILRAEHLDICDGRPFLELKYCEGGSLGKYIDKAYETGHIEESKVVEILLQISSGLSYLHREGVIHRDLKPDNILIDEDHNYLITDFGISSQMRKTLRKSVRAENLNSYTPAYTSPESFKSLDKPAPANDIFSLGVIIAELCSGDVPWRGFGGRVLQPTDPPLKLPKAYSSSLERLMQDCLRFDPSERPTALSVYDRLTMLTLNTVSKEADPETLTDDPNKTRRKDHNQYPRLSKNMMIFLGIGASVLGTLIVVWLVSAATWRLYQNKINTSKRDEISSYTKADNASSVNSADTTFSPAVTASRKVESNQIKSTNNNDEGSKNNVPSSSPKGYFPGTDIPLPEMVRVEGGTFQMGTDRAASPNWDKPSHPVRINSFQIGKYEITQRQWAYLMGRDTTKIWNSWNRNCPNCPVDQVEWGEAQTFIEKLNNITNGGYRLPTEAEWEYAARGGKYSHGYTYSGSNNIRDVAWYEGNSGRLTHNVGTKLPNELGIYDMSGNAMEWCADDGQNLNFDKPCYPSTLVDNPIGRGDGKYHLVRGGGAYTWADFARVYTRMNSDEASWSEGGPGFRLAKDY